MNQMTMNETAISLRVLSWRQAVAFVHLWPTHLVSLVDPDDGDLVAPSPRPDLDRLELFATWLRWAQRQEFWWPVPSRVVADAASGRASWQTRVELVMAPTHKQRGVDRGRWRP